MAQGMQRVGGLRESFLSFENLYLAYRKAYRGTKNYQAYRFAFFADKELLALAEELALGRYRPDSYSFFTITEPKVREISVASFRDRVVHHALNNIIEPIYEKRFIYHSYATRKQKGTHKAIATAQRFLKKNCWYLKMDIKSYFASIDHAVLNCILARKIKDPFILDLCGKIIARGGDGQKGLPIGNLTSQFFANVYLDIFDHYIKDILRFPHYLRYMDDYCLFSNDKSQLLDLWVLIESFLKEVLLLETKKSATLINTTLHGLPFLGVRIFPGMIRHIRGNFMRSYEKLQKRERDYRKKHISGKQYDSCMQSIISHLTRYSHHLLKHKLWEGAVSQSVPTV